MSTTTTDINLAADPYASRFGSGWEAVPRQDPVVWGDADGPLSDGDSTRYADDGFWFADDLFSEEEASRYLAEAERLAESVDPRAPGVIAEPESRGGTGVSPVRRGTGAGSTGKMPVPPEESRTVRSVFRVHRGSEAFRALCKDPRLVDRARQILGSEVYIHQSRINFKPPFEGKEFFWHSDFETWHIEDGMPRMRAVSVSVNLTENHEFNGPLMVVRGSHRHYIRCVGETPEEHHTQSLKKQEYGVPTREALAFLVEQGGIEAPKGRAGSALFFECNTMHGSVANLSPWPRTNLFLVFNSVENRLQAPFGGTPPRPAFLAQREVVPL